MNEAISAIDEQVDAVEPEAPFQHLHPLSIVLKSVSLLGRNIILIGVLYFSLFDQNLLYTALAALAIMVIVFGLTALIWSRFTYQVEAKEIRIKSGLINRNNRSIPFDRIQDVSLEQKLLSRLLGLTTVRFETGSGGGEDGALDALKLSDGEALRDVIRDYKSGVTGDGAKNTVAEETPEKPPLFAMDNRRILTAGIFNFSFILLAVLGTIAQNLDFLIPEGFFDPRNWIETISQQNNLNGLSMAARIGGVIAAIASLIAIGVFSGVVRTFIREYGFRLDQVDTGQPGFRRRRGLFTLTDMVMPIHRVQAAIISTGPVRQSFGWHHLKFQSLAGDQSGETDHSAAPCAKPEEIDPIIAETQIHSLPDGTIFHPVNHAFWWRDSVIIWLVLKIAALGLGFFVHTGFFALILLALPLIALQFLNWRHHQFALTESQLFVRSGWWKRKLTMLPLRKIQTADISQSPLDHPLDLATLTIGIAGGSALSPLRIMDIEADKAVSLRNQLLPS
ncbi:MAG: PH domain-containing protein [Parasphingorhabdus sp.]